MKKIEYVAPEMEVVKINNNIALLAGSINEDGEITPTPTNPSGDDWGSDY